MSVTPTNTTTDRRIEVFYDGACPLCLREIRFLRRLDKSSRFLFTDISSEEFRAADYGKTLESFMSEIHARLPEGTWIRGVEVFRRLYASLGFAPLVWITRLPGVAGLLDGAYHIFARNRLRWTCTPGETARDGELSSRLVQTFEPDTK